MPGALWARERVKERWLAHRYTRVPRGEMPQPANGPAFQDQDPWGNPTPLQDTDVGAPAPIPDLHCLFLDAGQFLNGPQGPIQVDTPTLLVAYDDLLQPGDLVRDVTDPLTGKVLVHEEFVDTVAEHAPSGPVMWRVFTLQHAEAG